MKSIILQMHDQLINGKKTVAEFVDESINKINEIKYTNSVITDSFSLAKEKANKLNDKIEQNHSNLLFGIPFAMKDNVCTKGVITTGGSLFLKDFVPPYNATITTLLDSANSIMVCKSNLDEFGLGGTGTYSAYGIVKSILNNELIVGGSSSGSTNLVAANAVPFAIGTDTGDSVRRPPSFLGVVGYKPTYGLISRYGILPYAPSLDHVGVIAQTVIDTAIVSESLVSYDSKDFSSQKIDDCHFYKNIKQISKLKVGVIKNLEKYLPPNTCKAYLDAIKIIEKQGHTIVYIDFDEKLLKAIHAIYYAISYSEAVSCWANLSGIIFGANFGGTNYDEILKVARSKTLGDQIKRRFTIGQYITRKDNFDKVFLRAQKIRRFLVNKWVEALSKVDTLMCVGASTVAPSIQDVQSQKFSASYADDLLCIANFGGTPSITIPYKKVDGLPFGLNFNCKLFEDQKLFNVALTFEEIFEKNGGADE